MRIRDLKERLLTFVAQSLQRWAKWVLERQELTSRREREQDILHSTESPLASEIAGTDDANGNAQVSPPAAESTGGPPAHWVERVRHAAPQLLSASSQEVAPSDERQFTPHATRQQDQLVVSAPDNASIGNPRSSDSVNDASPSAKRSLPESTTDSVSTKDTNRVRQATEPPPHAAVRSSLTHGSETIRHRIPQNTAATELPLNIENVFQGADAVHVDPTVNNDLPRAQAFITPTTSDDRLATSDEQQPSSTQLISHASFEHVSESVQNDIGDPTISTAKTNVQSTRSAERSPRTPLEGTPFEVIEVRRAHAAQSEVSPWTVLSANELHAAGGRVTMIDSRRAARRKDDSASQSFGFFPEPLRVSSPYKELSTLLPTDQYWQDLPPIVDDDELEEGVVMLREMERLQRLDREQRGTRWRG